MQTEELLSRLKRHYIKPGGAPGGIFVPEVGINGSWGSGSRCDAVYVGFTSASGRVLVGHELKISRADWLNELNKPGKADTWADGCHEWYVVAPSTEVVPPEEIPADWGLMVVNPRSKTRLKTVVKARTKDTGVVPWDLARSILGRIEVLARTEQGQQQRELEAKLRTKIAKDERERALRAAEVEGRHLRELVDRLEAELGVELASWSRGEAVTPELLGKALRLIETQERLSSRYAGLGYTIERTEEALGHMRALSAALFDYENQGGQQ